MPELQYHDPSLLVAYARRHEDEEDVFGFAKMDEGVIKALEELRAEEQAKNDRQLALQMHEIEEEWKKHKAMIAALIRRYNKTIDAEVARGKARDRCLAYAKETGNYIPLAVFLNLVGASYVPEGVITSVPEDWKPRVAEDET